MTTMKPGRPTPRRTVPERRPGPPFVALVLLVTALAGPTGAGVGAAASAGGGLPGLNAEAPPTSATTAGPRSASAVGAARDGGDAPAGDAGHPPPAAFELAGQRVPPGEGRAFHASAGGARIPITVLNGTRPGPVLTLTAGIHGDEFPPVLALQRLRASVDPRALGGVLVLVHAANPAALHQYGLSALHPEDGANLNRAFPGRADGTPTQRLAHFFTSEIIARTDYLIDMHSGSAHQALWPHVYAPFVGDAELDRRTLAFARATGMRHIVLYGDRPRDPARSISYPNTAMTRGKPGLTIEIGDLGRRDERYVTAYLEALGNALHHLGMLEGAVPAGTGAMVYDRLHDVDSPARGLVYPQVRIGELVGEGTLLAVVTDYFGSTLAEVRAPARGVVLMLTQRPTVNAAASIATIASW